MTLNFVFKQRRKDERLLLDQVPKKDKDYSFRLRKVCLPQSAKLTWSLLSPWRDFEYITADKHIETQSFWNKIVARWRAIFFTNQEILKTGNSKEFESRTFPVNFNMTLKFFLFYWNPSNDNPLNYLAGQVFKISVKGNHF